MAASTPKYRLIVAVGVMGFLILLVMAWGLQESLQPTDSQRVSIHSPQSPFDANRAYRDLEAIVAIGPRVAGTQNSVKTREYIVQQLEKAQVQVKIFPFQADTPLGQRSMANIVGVIPGGKPGIIMLGNHYDTKYLPDIHFVGANDGGSTTAWMIEMARVLGPKRSGSTIWLCFFDGEEAFGEWSDTDGLYGSRQMVGDLGADETLQQIEVMINVDMIGDCYLGVFKDTAGPPWLQNLIWDTAKNLRYGNHFLEISSHLIEDDHVPFRRAGVPAINLIDFRYGGSIVDHNKNWHTANDTIDRVCPESLQAVGDVIYHVIMALDNR